jgi:hypothetical protein
VNADVGDTAERRDELEGDHEGVRCADGLDDGVR